MSLPQTHFHSTVLRHGSILLYQWKDISNVINTKQPKYYLTTAPENMGVLPGPSSSLSWTLQNIHCVQSPAPHRRVKLLTFHLQTWQDLVTQVKVQHLPEQDTSIPWLFLQVNWRLCDFMDIHTAVKKHINIQIYTTSSNRTVFPLNSAAPPIFNQLSMVKQNYSEQYLLWFKYVSLQDIKTPTPWPAQMQNNIMWSLRHVCITHTKKIQEIVCNITKQPQLQCYPIIPS
jgi:hypothetical protein